MLTIVSLNKCVKAISTTIYITLKKCFKKIVFEAVRFSVRSISPGFSIAWQAKYNLDETFVGQLASPQRTISTWFPKVFSVPDLACDARVNSGKIDPAQNLTAFKNYIFLIFFCSRCEICRFSSWPVIILSVFSSHVGLVANCTQGYDASSSTCF